MAIVKSALFYMNLLTFDLY